MKRILLIVIILLVIGGVALMLVSPKQPAGPSEQVVVGWFGPLSGPVASLGEENLRGVELAIADFGQGKVTLKTEDDQFTVPSSFSAYEKLSAAGVDVMLSPTYNAIMALAPRADSDKRFVINSLDASSEIADAGEYVFGIGYYADGHGANFARTIEENGGETVAVLYNQGETFTQLIVDAFQEEFDGNLVLVEGYQPTTTDFRTVISKMKSQNVDTVLLIGWDEAGFFVKQSGELGFVPGIYGLASFTSPGFLGNAGETASPLYYLGWDQESKEYKEIVAKYEAAYGKAPAQPLFVALGYDAMTFVLTALADGTDHDTFRTNLYSTTLRGLTGTLDLDDDGIVRGITTQSKLFRVE